MNARLPHARSQRGITLIGLVFWAVLISSAALLAMRVIPTVNEYLTIKRVVSRIADSGGPELAHELEREGYDKYARAA